MNLAIIISVSDYVSLNRLPGCKNDALLMKNILDNTSKFEDTLVLDESKPSDFEKQNLIEFIDGHKDQKIEELFFYYSGHGDFDNNEFYYLLADYDNKKKQQTSLKNSELDILLRSLKPELTVKVIDACHSGVEYIKEKDSLSKYIGQTEQSFKRCYFMFSSESNQSSYANQKISYFTRAFAQALTAQKTELVRYRSITDYISDEFENNKEQQPLFISQANGTEVFCNKGKNFDDTIKKLLEDFGISTALVPQGISHGSLVERVKADAEKYCSKDEALDVLEKFKESFFSEEIQGDVNELYDLKRFEQSDYSNLLNVDEIGRWINQNKGEFFAEPITIREKIEPDTSSPFMRSLSGLGSMFGPHYRTVTTGVKSTEDLPFNQLRISANPKLPNIEKTSLIIVPFLSQTTILIFYAFVNYQISGWNDTFTPQAPKWLIRQVGLRDKDEIQNFIREIINLFVEFTMNPIIETFDTTEGEIVESDEAPRDELGNKLKEVKELKE